MTNIEAETLTRFAAEFLYRVKWASPTAQGLEIAYLETIQPYANVEDDLYAHIQDLAERVYKTHNEEFRTWIVRENSKINEALADYYREPRNQNQR